MGKYGSEYDEEGQVDKKLNLKLWQIMLILLFAITVLVIGYLDLKNNITINMKFPNGKLGYSDKQVIYKLNGANKTYYEIWGDYLIRNISNFTPNNVNEKLNLIYGEMQPTDAIKIKSKVEDFKENVVINKIKQDFIFTKPKIFMEEGIDSKAKVVIDGISRIYSNGSKNYVKKECSYEVNFKFSEGVFYVKDFGTNCF